jgi:hydrogenase nickel incorporation protein HypA/HybF
MHELSLARDVLRVCIARLEGAPARLERVRVAVGELSAIEPDLLRFAWEAVVAGGPHADARIEVDWRPARQVCDACGDVQERAAGSWLRLCPRCERPLRIEGGQELDVLEMSYEPLDSAGEAPR